MIQQMYRFEAMPDIPRIYTALAEAIACMAMIYTVKRKYRGWRQLLAVVVLLTVQCVFLEITGGLSDFFWILAMMAAILFMIAGIRIQTECSWRSCAYLGMEAFILSEFMASVEWQLDYYFAHNISWYGTVASMVFLVVLYAIGFVFGWKFFNMQAEPDQSLYVTRREMVTMAVITVSVFIISNLTFTDFQSPFRLTGYDPVAPSLVRTMVDLCGVMMICFFHTERKQFYAREELNAVRNVLQNQYIQYKQSRESIELINVKYHDLKHQINYLKQADRSLEGNEILTQIEDEIHLYETQNKTGNQVVDTILTSKSILCDKKG